MQVVEWNQSLYKPLKLLLRVLDCLALVGQKTIHDKMLRPHCLPEEAYSWLEILAWLEPVDQDVCELVPLTFDDTFNPNEVAILHEQEWVLKYPRDISLFKTWVGSFDSEP